MTETDNKIKLQAEWLKSHTLTPEQNKQLILGKLKRAEEHHKALLKREMLVQKYR